LRQDLPAPQIGNEMDNGYRLLDVQPNEYLLYGAFDLPSLTGQPMERTTLILLEKRLDGQTRLIVRTRGYIYGTFGKLVVMLYEVLDFLDAQAQLNNLKVRVEMLAQLNKPVTTPAANPATV
jgi:hypothetical protein